jgi:hypothetical protein
VVALQDAAIAGLMISTEATLAERPKANFPARAPVVVEAPLAR